MIENKITKIYSLEGDNYMNKIILTGRLVKDPEIRYSAGENPTAVVRYTLAVDRLVKREGEPTADFIRCVAFGKPAAFAEKYLTKGIKIAVTGRIQTGCFNKNGNKVYTTDVIVESQEFCESKAKSSAATSGSSFNNSTFADNATDDAAYQYFN